jgi:hypothetical protein
MRVHARTRACDLLVCAACVRQSQRRSRRRQRDADDDGVGWRSRRGRHDAGAGRLESHDARGQVGVCCDTLIVFVLIACDCSATIDDKYLIRSRDIERGAKLGEGV